MNNVTPILKEEKILDLEIKSLDEKGTFEGYGSVFGNKDSYGDIVEKGAFKDFLNKNKPATVKLLWQHNTQEPIGVYEEIKEDDKGLYVRGRLLIEDVARAREAYALMKAGAINGLSIGFTINSNGSEYGKNGIRHLNSLSLWEISVVTFPANARAQVANIKENNMDDIKTIRDFENFLRDAGGFSKSQAVAIANHGYTKGLQRDAEDIVTTSDDEANKKLSEDVLLILTALENGVKSL